MVLYTSIEYINGFPSTHDFMKKALFTNFSKEAFTHAWNSEVQTFQAGESYEMPDYLAEHFALHLTNRELLKTGIEANIRAVNPKDRSKSGIFMSFFKKAYKVISDEEMSEERASTKKVTKPKKGKEVSSDITLQDETISSAKK